jgi:hypothetical protein
MWAGPIVDIPEFWALCDGTNGTPDLRNRFVVGAGDDFEPADTGGQLEHEHDFTGDGHQHSVTTTHECPGSGGVEAWSSGADGGLVNSTQAMGVTDLVELSPPFYALAYIQRVA